MMYATLDYYKNTFKGGMDDATATAALDEASVDIDTLTFGRAKVADLSEFQQNTLARVCCEMAEFNNANAAMLSNMLTSYSLNGASMSFSGESASVTTVMGTIIERRTYEHLKQTGLCCLSVGV